MTGLSATTLELVLLAALWFAASFFLAYVRLHRQARRRGAELSAAKLEADRLRRLVERRRAAHGGGMCRKCDG